MSFLKSEKKRNKVEGKILKNGFIYISTDHFLFYLIINVNYSSMFKSLTDKK